MYLVVDRNGIMWTVKWWNKKRSLLGIIFFGDSITLCMRQPLSVIRWQLLYQKLKRIMLWKNVKSHSPFSIPSGQHRLTCIWSGYTYQRKKAVKGNPAYIRKEYTAINIEFLLIKRQLLLLSLFLKKDTHKTHFPQELMRDYWFNNEPLIKV